MNFLELAKKRYSCRHYLNNEVEEEKLMYIIEAGRIAPSAANRQPWHFIVVNDPEIKNSLYKAYSRDWFIEAPIILIICGEHKNSWKRQYDKKDHCDIDVAIATDHITLAAAEVGLATCWICAFDAVMVSNILDLPSDLEPVVVLPIGYPADNCDVNRHKTLRKKMYDVLTWNGL